MNTSDRWIVRLVGVTVCLSAFVLVLAVVILSLWERPVPEILDRLGFLLAGGLLTALTTRLSGETPVEVTANPADPLPVYTEE